MDRGSGRRPGRASVAPARLPVAGYGCPADATQLRHLNPMLPLALTWVWLGTVRLRASRRRGRRCRDATQPTTCRPRDGRGRRLRAGWVGGRNGGCGAAGEPGEPGSRSERDRLRPEHAGRRDPGDGRRDQRRSRSTTRWAPSGTRCCSSPASTAPTPTRCSIQVGYYTEVAGLGASPADVTINGKIDVYNRCLDNGGTATASRWSTSGARCPTSHDINAAGQDGCRASANFWAVSQAAPMRRVNVNGGTLSLMDYCTAGPQFASGGFIADSRTGTVINGSQQQWLTRNSEIGGWSNGVWNQVFAGVEGAPADATFPNPPYTTLDTNPLSREKPYLFVDADGRYNVCVAVRAARLARRHLGERPDAGPHAPAHRLLRRQAVGLGADDQQPAGPRQEPAPHPRRVRRRTGASRSSAPARSCSASASPP